MFFGNSPPSIFEIEPERLIDGRTNFSAIFEPSFVTFDPHLRPQ